MAQMLLINPRRRRRKARRAHSRRRRHVARRRVARRRRAVATNPIRRHRRHRRHIARNPHRRRRIRRNPFGSAGGILKNEVMPAALGAVGAVGLDVIWGNLGSFLPVSVTSNVYLNAAVKGAGAVGLGWLASKGLGRERGKAVAVGALTVIAYELLHGVVKQMAPTLPMAGYGSLGAYMPMGAYMPAPALPAPAAHAMHGFGAYNPAPYLQGSTDFGPGVSDSMF